MTDWPEADTPRALAPADTRVYAIGDVHGCTDLLKRLHDAIRRDADEAPESRKVVVYLGDSFLNRNTGVFWLLGISIVVLGMFVTRIFSKLKRR